MSKLEKQNAEQGSGPDYQELKEVALPGTASQATQPLLGRACRGAASPPPIHHPITLNIK